MTRNGCLYPFWNAGHYRPCDFSFICNQPWFIADSLGHERGLLKTEFTHTEAQGKVARKILGMEGWG